MKQVKFLFVALMAIVMSVSVTSCMNTDNNTQVSNQPIIGKVKENFLNLIFTSMDGYTFPLQKMQYRALLRFAKVILS